MTEHKKTVEFDAHKVEKKLLKKSTSRTKSGKEIDFIADKPTKVPVHVKFKAKPKK